MNNVMTARSLATLFNAQGIADQRHDEDGEDWAVLKTGNDCQPYIVERYAGQLAAVSLSTSQAASALRFANTARPRG
ncbi:hypothetical protein [Novosphingobium terrae]|uniref:hypothetical protein n=1 Tax=Novosphingobium terrae TaxID=2726189 RepID=UPI0019808D07|nr:hypothetical protein [Novosphingobium terrae]